MNAAGGPGWSSLRVLAAKSDGAAAAAAAAGGGSTCRSAWWATGRHRSERLAAQWSRNLPVLLNVRLQAVQGHWESSAF